MGQMGDGGLRRGYACDDHIGDCLPKTGEMNKSETLVRLLGSFPRALLVDPSPCCREPKPGFYLGAALHAHAVPVLKVSTLCARACQPCN